jgi:hypothetical protein
VNNHLASRSRKKNPAARLGPRKLGHHISDNANATGFFNGVMLTASPLNQVTDLH